MATDLTTLRMLLALSEGGSTYNAAAVLGVDAATVSRRMAALERKAGVPLFVKRSTGTVFTDAGLQLLDAADAAVVAVTNFDLLLETIANRHAKPVTISAPEGIGSYLLTPQLAGFADTSTPIRFPQDALPQVSILPMESRADIEIILVHPGSDIHRQGEYKARKLGIMRFLPVVAKSYLTKNSAPGNFKELGKAPLLNHLIYSSHPSFVQWADIAHSSPTGPLVNVSTSSALHRAVLTGRGIALLPDFSEEIDELVSVLPIGDRIGVELWATATPESLKLPTVKRAWDVIGTAFFNSPWFN
ncbi:DNA-binding transcriptional LysR family regulator [Azospirillum lipoferum]|uniref:LysR family transcriptional regulator n=1 Tax=Azospirillum lipoferum TaxID=193 RepID=A0A5A9GD93_AZOLI|nr:MULTISPECIES: LysR family transcriptional regulator [Azospirillum]KAA0592366.1 LysR family transcriptional regulator [Azospirillum lipoferum]MCP1614601.1 DNA-binding transcriptional LysR family regulator [Azospirillum lipoferum]MDW5532568.1 LysR family transcriptional regulator [Azospirillum sp. NL1]